MDIALARRQRRRTWILGGILLIVPAVIDIVLQVATGARLGWISGLIFLLAVIVFTVGIGSAGSITARRPLGTISALVFAVLLAVGTLLPGLLLLGSSPSSGGSAEGDMAAIVARGAMIGLASLAIGVVALVFGIIAAVQIARAGVVPRPWCWAPLWVLLADVVSSLLGMLLPVLLATSGLSIGQTANLIAAGISAAAEIFLGIVAIALAVNERPTAAPLPSSYAAPVG